MKAAPLGGEARFVRGDLKEQLTDYAAVQRLVETHPDEDEQLEFKGEPYRRADLPSDVLAKRRLELARDVASLANAKGGILIIGVGQNEKGYADKINPFDDLLGHEDWTAGVLAQSIQPRLDDLKILRLMVVDDIDRGVLLVFVGKADAGKPRAVARDGQLEFWVRVGKSKRPMSYEQLEHRFGGGQETAIARQVDANAVSDVLRLRRLIEAADEDWARIEDLFKELRPYCREYPYGDVVRERAFWAVAEALSGVRYELPLSTAALAFDLIFELLPIRSLVAPTHEPVTTAELDLIESAADQAFTLMYQASRRMGSASIINIAGQFIHEILRFAVVNQLTELRENLLKELDSRIEWASKDALEPAARLLEFYRADALAPDSTAPWDALGEFQDFAFKDDVEIEVPARPPRKRR